MSVPKFSVALLAALLWISACGSDTASNESGEVGVLTSAPTVADQKFPNVLDVEASNEGDTWTFDVTISSPYDSAERYADGWRVIGPDGAILGEHELGHDHASEQPFTRTQSGVEIAADVDSVTIEGRDQANGFGGKTYVVALERGEPQ